MPSYNISMLQNTEYLSDLVIYANAATNNTFTFLVLLAVTFIILLMLKSFSLNKAIMPTSFIMLILSIILATGGLLSIAHIFTFGLILAVIMFLDYLNMRDA